VPERPIENGELESEKAKEVAGGALAETKLPESKRPKRPRGRLSWGRASEAGGGWGACMATRSPNGRWQKQAAGIHGFRVSQWQKQAAGRAKDVSDGAPCWSFSPSQREARSLVECGFDLALCGSTAFQLRCALTGHGDMAKSFSFAPEAF
jgi:hypothetical protein